MRRLILLLLLTSFAMSEDVEILHWWTSDGEAKAAQALQFALKEEGVNWLDAAIEGGGGEGAMAVLKSRVLQGRAPAAAQIIGPDIQQWAQLGFLGHFNIVALAHDWPTILHPTVDSLVQHADQYVAVPFGVHRINWLWVNKAWMERSQMTQPLTWADFFELAEYFQTQGIVPLAHGNEPWQNATLFEVVVLSVGGPEFYNDVFVENSEEAIASSLFADALTLLAKLKLVMDQQINGRTWQEASQMVVDGRAGMQIMGDWVLGELRAWQRPDEVLCLSAPNTQNLHLYSVDTMVMFQDPELSSYKTQLTFAETVLRPEVQLAYASAKGAVPVRADTIPAELGDCGQVSYQLFRENERTESLSPSLAHSMAKPSEIEDVFVDVIHSFFQKPNTPVESVQQKLLVNLRSIRR